MSLSRAFTTRRAKGGSQDFGDATKLPHRSNTLHKLNPQQGLRHKISAPVQLVHTTNMLSYNAPDLPRPNRSNSGAMKSEDESDSATVAESTPPTSPEAEPFENCSPAPNHLSSYFVAPGTTIIHPTSFEAPAIPKRSPSHTKKSSHDILTRKQSLSRISKGSDQSISPKNSVTFSRSSSTSTRASSVSNSSAPHAVKQAPPPIPIAVALPMPPPPPQAQPQHHHQRPSVDSHPFGQELAKVTELAEEFSAKGRLDVIREDEQYMRKHNLVRMSPEDYLSDITALMASFFPEEKIPRTLQPMWI